MRSVFMEIVFVGDHQEPIHDCDDHRHSDWELVLYRDLALEKTLSKERLIRSRPAAFF